MHFAAKTVGIAAATLTVVASAWGAAALDGRREAAQAAQAGGKAEIFCENLSAGQLCLHGTVEVLKLDADKQAKWREAGRRYNQAVEAATKQFVAEVRGLLSPADAARVEQWFDKSVNAYLNQRLLGTTASR